MQEIEIFKNEEFGTVRVVDVNGEPYFVGKDVAEILGYSNASKAVLDHVDEEDKCFKMLGVSDSQNGNLVKTALINESGLYRTPPERADQADGGRASGDGIRVEDGETSGRADAEGEEGGLCRRTKSGIGRCGEAKRPKVR